MPETRSTDERIDDFYQRLIPTTRRSVALRMTAKEFGISVVEVSAAVRRAKYGGAR